MRYLRKRNDERRFPFALEYQDLEATIYQLADKNRGRKKIACLREMHQDY
jgi:hypothetical protein